MASLKCLQLPHGTPSQQQRRRRPRRPRPRFWCHFARLYDAGMTTAEYAVGTLAACGFAGVLWVVVHSGTVHNLLQSVIGRALNLAP